MSPHHHPTGSGEKGLGSFSGNPRRLGSSFCVKQDFQGRPLPEGTFPRLRRARSWCGDAGTSPRDAGDLPCPCRENWAEQTNQSGTGFEIPERLGGSLCHEIRLGPETGVTFDDTCSEARRGEQVYPARRSTSRQSSCSKAAAAHQIVERPLGRWGRSWGLPRVLGAPPAGAAGSCCANTAGRDKACVHSALPGIWGHCHPPGPHPVPPHFPQACSLFGYPWGMQRDAPTVASLPQGITLGRCGSQDMQPPPKIMRM